MRIQAGEPAMDFKAEDLDGNTIRLRDYQEKRLLLSFFRYAS